MSLFPNPRERQQNKVDRWHRQGLYPEGCKNWEAFIDFCNKNTGKPFVMTLESIGGRPESVIKEYIFGIMNVKGSCFGLNSFSLIFQSEESGGYHFFGDGLSEKDLDLRSLFGRKISEVSFESEKINTTLCVYTRFVPMVVQIEELGGILSPEEIRCYAQMYQYMKRNFFAHLPQEGFRDSHRTFEQLRNSLETLLAKQVLVNREVLRVAKKTDEIYATATKLLE